MPKVEFALLPVGDMKTVRVDLGERSYDILISAGLLESFPRLLNQFESESRIFLVSNSEVFRLFGEDLVGRLAEGGYQAETILIPDGEAHKNLQTVEGIYTALINGKADRSSIVAALGGGVTGDIVGFAAASFLRGIPYIQIPTTLLAQVDSSVGGKTGVNHPLAKNMIGAFWQPHLVTVDTRTLDTLPGREFQSGLYEVVKYGLICDPEFFEYFEEHLGEIRDRNGDVLEETVKRCCEIKADIVSRDEKEQDLRRILNFGHTFGHALEAATEYRTVTHGEAVGYGMIAATHLSRIKGVLDSSHARRAIRCLQEIGKLPDVGCVAIESLLEAMKRDKKRRGDQVVFVLLESIGETCFVAGIEENVLAEAWELTTSAGPSC